MNRFKSGYYFVSVAAFIRLKSLAHVTIQYNEHGANAYTAYYVVAIVVSLHSVPREMPPYFTVLPPLAYV